VEQETLEKRNFRTPATVIIGAGLIAIAVSSSLLFTADGSGEREQRRETYPVHRDITATVFWVGESADSSNKFIHNQSSAWVEDWVSAYGGIDNPDNRCDHLPCSFVPHENPFYFALPYNDIDENGELKPSARNIPWFTATQEDDSSIVKNRWIKIVNQNKTVYAQWEDVGPFGEDDFNYVFGDERPAAPEAGIDLSPATASWIGVDGRSVVSWQFVNDTDVPDGPWRKTITRD
jgi:hypothetical protein